MHVGQTEITPEGHAPARLGMTPVCSALSCLLTTNRAEARTRMAEPGAGVPASEGFSELKPDLHLHRTHRLCARHGAESGLIRLHSPWV